jgi:Xaa-Pro aminopeptidase
MQFDPEFYSSNRRRLMERSASEIIVISSHGLLQMSKDVTYPYRQDSNFLYLTGIAEPGYTLVLRPDGEYLIADQASDVRELFDGVSSSEEVIRVSGVDEVVPAQEGWRRLDSDIEVSGQVGIIEPAPSYIADYEMHTNPSRRRLKEKLSRRNRNIKYTDIAKDIADLRVVKQPAEIAAIRHAIDTTATILNRLWPKELARMKSENEVEGYVTAAFRAQNMHHAYEPIVASAGRACLIHYAKNNHSLPAGSLLLMDVGAKHNNYPADITRTYPIGQPTARQQAITRRLIDVHEAMINEVKPGVSVNQLERTAERYLGEALRQLGLLQQPDDRRQVRKFFPHAVSHYLGLDVHDVGDRNALYGQVRY